MFDLKDDDGDDEITRKIARRARRNAMKKKGGQDLYKPKVFKNRKKFTRKQKHKEVLDIPED